jgi:hypothetical protein
MVAANVHGLANRQPVTAAEFINKSSLFILLLGVIRRLELKPNSEQKAENIFVAPPYCQTACWAFVLPYFGSKFPPILPLLSFIHFGKIIIILVFHSRYTLQQ